MKKILINIIGTPRIYMKENKDSILKNIILCNKEYRFDIIVHTSYHYEETFVRKEVNKKRTLVCKNEEELKNIILNHYSTLSNNIDIIIENIDFDIGLNNYSYKSFINYLRIKRTFDIIKSKENNYDYIVTCRNDIIFTNEINLNNLGNNFYTILGKTGGFKGYANGDFDGCLIFNNKNYIEFNNCINFIFNYDLKKQLFYKTENLKFISPLFENKYPFLDKNYYNNLGNIFNQQISDKNTTRTICGLGEIFINHLTHFLKKINSKWDLFHFHNVNIKILWPN